MTTLFILLVLFQIKHFICDYPLQNEYMLGKFKPNLGFVLPLMCHCFVHFIGTLAISLCVTDLKYALIMATFDFITHFIVDRIKASPNLLGRFKPNQKEFWWALGADQFCHHIVHYLIIFALLKL